MRSELDHLPPAKQRELERVVQILFEEFADATALATQSWKKQGRILKVILYGSYARGGWVDEPHTAKGYQSDFDLLVIVSDKRLTDRVDYWVKAEERLNRELAITRTLKTPVNFIVHTLQDVNDGLTEGRYFFMDVVKDGIALYESEDTEFAAPKPKTPQAALALAKEYFERWSTTAQRSLRTYHLQRGEGDDVYWRNKAAFELHQTTEQLYNCVLLVCTFYTPHTHNLGFLRTQAERLDLRLIDAWPRDVKTDRARFEKLKDAYVKARYSKHYSINEEELAWLGAQVEELTRAVEAVCTQRIAGLEAAASA